MLMRFPPASLANPALLVVLAGGLLEPAKEFPPASLARPAYAGRADWRFSLGCQDDFESACYIPACYTLVIP